jgi:MFS family permease
MTPAGSAVDRTFRSLRTRNYRLYFFGQIISLTGTWMQSVGQAWLVLELTGSGVALGIVTALQFLPILLAGAWGGVVADRGDKRKVILATQTAAAVLALALGLLTVTGAVRLWMVYALALGLGLVNLVDMPTRQSFVFEMVGKEDVTNAVSLNSVVVNASRVVGPAVAGLLIATVGIGICFLVNAASYVAVIAGLHLMDPAKLQDQPRAPRERGQLREGLRYVWRTSELRTPILLMAAVGTIAYNFSVLFPLLVRSTFGRGAGAYGTLFSLMGVGAVLGGLVVAARSRATAFLLVGSTIALGALLWLGALAPTFWLEMIAVVPVGAASTAFIATSNAMLQLHSAPQMRGRVMALFTVVFLGTTPIGAPVVGWIAQGFGPRAGLAFGATTTLLAGVVALVVLARRRKVSKRVVRGRPMTAEDAQAVTAA